MTYLRDICFMILFIQIIRSGFSLSEFPTPGHNDNVAKTGILPVCSDYIASHNEIDLFSVRIPANRTNEGIYNSSNEEYVNFLLQNRALKCAENYGTRIIPINLGREVTLLSPRNYSSLDINTNEVHQHSYFTLSGHFYDHTSRYFYKPDGDYCMSSYTGSDLTLRICIVNEGCSSSATPNTWCVPKCCAIDESVDYKTRICSRTEGTPWTPPIYNGINNADQKADDSSMNFIFQMSQLHKNCNLKVFSRQKCGFKHFMWLFSSDVPDPRDLNQTLPSDEIKMVPRAPGKTGMVQIIGLNMEDKWEGMPNMVDFCVDHFVTNESNSIRTNDDFVVYHCDREDEKEVAKRSSAVTNTVIYTYVSIVALIFLFATICVYAALWDKHNLHGLTIFSYTVANFGSYLFLLFAHVIFLLSLEDCVATLTTGPYCYAIAVLAHYFYLSSYLWLTVMNFDLWRTFSSFRAVRRDSKELGKFGWYSMFAWIFPMLLVIIFIIIDQVYRGQETQVIAPEYATGSCFIARKSRGQYIYIPMAIMLGANIILIGLTMKIFISANQASKSITGSVKNANRYSAKLFAKLFVVMGGVYIVDFLTWYYSGKDEVEKHWAIAVLEGITYLTPVVLFVLFCLNDRILNQLREKYPAFTDALDPVLKYFRKTDATHSHYEHNEHSSNKTNVSSYATMERGTEMTTVRKSE